MTDEPKRLVDDPTTSTATRELLRAVAAPAPSREQARELWTSIEASLGVPGGPEGGGEGSGPGAPPGATSPTNLAGGGVIASSVFVEKTGSSLLSTWLVIGAGAAASVAVALAVVSPSEVPRSPVPVKVVALRPAERPEAAGGEVPHPTDLSALAPAVSAEPSSRSSTRSPAIAGVNPEKDPTTSAPAPLEAGSAPLNDPIPSSSLAREEAAATRAARDRLRGGDAVGALALLDTAAVRFGSGLLGQERTALTVEALGRSGQVQGASALAHQFLARWPASTHADRVRPWAR